MWTWYGSNAKMNPKSYKILAFLTPPLMVLRSKHGLSNCFFESSAVVEAKALSFMSCFQQSKAKPNSFECVKVSVMVTFLKPLAWSVLWVFCKITWKFSSWLFWWVALINWDFDAPKNVASHFCECSTSLLETGAESKLFFANSTSCWHHWESCILDIVHTLVWTPDMSRGDACFALSSTKRRRNCTNLIGGFPTREVESVGTCNAW